MTVCAYCCGPIPALPGLDPDRGHCAESCCQASGCRGDHTTKETDA